MPNPGQFVQKCGTTRCTNPVAKIHYDECEVYRAIWSATFHVERWGSCERAATAVKFLSNGSVRPFAWLLHTRRHGRSRLHPPQRRIARRERESGKVAANHMAHGDAFEARP